MAISDAEREAIEAYERELAVDLLTATQTSLWDMLWKSAQRYAEHDALRSADGDLSYEELAHRSLRCAARLEAMGIGKGSRVSLLFHNCFEWVVVHYALMRLGAVVVPINLAYEASEVRWVLERGRTELIISPDAALGLDFAGKLAQVDPGITHGAVEIPGLPHLRRVHILPTEDIRVLPESPAYTDLFGTAGDPGLCPRGAARGPDPSYVLFTSGSTAHPKPALCRHGAYVGCAVALTHALGFGPGDVYTSYNPTFHSSGLIWNITLPHAVGGAGYLMPKFDGATVLSAITERKVTHAGAFDTMFTMMMAAQEDEPADVSHIKGWSIGCTPSFMRRVMETWTLSNPSHIYGSTESSGIATLMPRCVTDAETRISTNGRPLPGIEVRIIDPESGEESPTGTPGEICFKGWSLFIEYLDMPEAMEEAFDADGFFHSGDYGWKDADGFVYFRGRYKMMIKTGGENVSQREVEIFLEDTLRFVRHAEVVGVPDETWGEAVVAFLEYEDGVERPIEELRNLCKGKIANFKVPKHFIHVEPGGWPILGSGRIDKPSLQRRALELLT